MKLGIVGEELDLEILGEEAEELVCDFTISASYVSSVMGFYGRMYDCSSLEVKHMEILRGLKMVIGEGFTHVDMEAESP